MMASSSLPSNPGSSGEAGPFPPATGADPVVEALACLERQAATLEGQPEALLALLRRIEQLHRSIQDGPFRSSLPADRNALFQLLSEMERSGGWPYIPRLQLRTFLDLLGPEAAAAGLIDSAGSVPEEAPQQPGFPGSSSLAA